MKSTSKPRTYRVKSFGCQMNVYDGERMAELLAAQGITPAPEGEDADLVVLNTCHIREKATEKVYSDIGRLVKAGEEAGRKPMIAVAGCVAQAEGEEIMARAPAVGMVVGPQAYHRLPEMLERAVKGQRSTDTDMPEDAKFAALPKRRKVAPTAFLTVQEGCDKFCTYCVVPYVRGPEMSRRPDRIIAEIEALVQAGAREVTLLGQNVNSYGYKEGLPSFAELLAQVNEIQGLRRIRFTTSHPKDMSDDLMEAFGKLDKLCPHIHLPVQSGSDRILKRMNRKYTRQLYLERIERLRRIRPDIAVTSDFIVGFPGESPNDFEDTVTLLKTVAFDSIFAFMYSDRSIAAASRFSDKVGEEEKKLRLQQLLKHQETITLAKNRALVGSAQEILLEGSSHRPGLAEHASEGPQWTGRTPGNKIVNINADRSGASAATFAVGQLVSVCIENAYAHSLQGVLSQKEPSNGGLKGNACHAA